MPERSRLCVQIWVVLLACIFSAQTQHCQADDSKKILLLLSGGSSVYQKVADSTIKRINKSCANLFVTCPSIEFEKINVADEKAVIPEESFITITYGTRAASSINPKSMHDHLILSMLPRQSTVAQKSTKVLQGAIKIYLDQPYKRYFELIKTTMPRASRVGLLLHASDSDESQSLSNAASKFGFLLKIELVENTQDIGEALSRMLDNIDVFLAIPDSRIHNNKTISNILTTAYRNNIPVIGFSSAYVKAGAAEAIYTSLDDIAHQASDAALQLLEHGSVSPKVQQAKYFSVSFNFEVARSLGLTIRSPSAVKSIIMREQGE